MSASLNELLARLDLDEWRQANGFTPEVAAANELLFANATNPEVQGDTINEWLRNYQPCLFGKAAAAQKAIEYCILNQVDLEKGDAFVRDEISRAHLTWTRSAFEGRSSSFVVVVVSQLIAFARPNDRALEFAKRLAQLYLQEDEIEVDRIYHDAAYLAIPGYPERVLKWKAGVNYFSAHGDKRWWQDHRIPGGLGFSINSVGHLAKSGRLLALLSETARELGLPNETRGGSRIDSLGRALQVAMQTIANASDGISGKATELVPLPQDTTQLPIQTCPVNLGGRLADKNYCWYKGYYHTDQTLPRLYFRDDVQRPDDVPVVEPLDFTYLLDDSVDNTAYQTMGTGIPIRADGVSNENSPSYKRDRVEPSEVPILSEPVLVSALKLAK